MVSKINHLNPQILAILNRKWYHYIKFTKYNYMSLFLACYHQFRESWLICAYYLFTACSAITDIVKIYYIDFSPPQCHLTNYTSQLIPWDHTRGRRRTYANVAKDLLAK